MRLFIYDKHTLEFKNIPFKKIILALFTPFFIFISLGITFAPDSNPSAKFLEVEKIIVINEHNEFSEEKFIAEIKRLNFNFPHIVLAQAKIESANFKSNIFFENNNLFGMKQARLRSSLASGTQYNHATYYNWKESLYDYAFYYSKYLSRINSEEEYLDYINQLYAEDPLYGTKVKNLSKNLKPLFEN